MDRRTRKRVGEAIKVLVKRANEKWVAGEDFKHDAAKIQTLLAREMTDDLDPAKLHWHTDLLERPDLEYITRKIEEGSSFLPLAARVQAQNVSAGGIFAHLKTTEMTVMPNWVRPSVGLLFGLMMTDLTGTKGSDIRMPLPAFIIEVPPDTIYLDNPQTGRHETKYIIVAEGESPIFGRSLFIYTWSAPNQKSLNIFDDNVEFFGLDLSSGGESLAEVFDVREEIREEETRAKELEQMWLVKAHRGGGSVFGEELSGKEMRRRLLRIVANTILYLASDGATYRSVHQDLIDEIEASNVGRRKMRPADEAKIKKLQDEPYYDVGTDITLTRADLDRMLEPSPKRAGGGKGTGRKLTAPSITRGHWRWQPYGPGRKLRKLKWIKPFVRGKELGGEVRPHSYTLEENPFFGDE